MEIEIGSRYQHYKKGAVYTVVGFAHHTEDQEKLVLYKPDVEPADLKSDYPKGVVFARPYSQFVGTTLYEGSEVQRFSQLDEEPTFIPQPGEVDFTHARWCPVVNCVVVHKDKFLIVKRNPNMRLYPDYWNGISGFIDDANSLEGKVLIELQEELNLSREQVKSITLCDIFHQDAPSINKTWIVHAMRVEVTTDVVNLNWEAKDFKWVTKDEALTYKLLPGFDEVIDAVL